MGEVTVNNSSIAGWSEIEEGESCISGGSVSWVGGTETVSSWLEKNLLYFLGAISLLNLGCASAIIFQSMFAALRIMEARIFISLLHDEVLLPLTMLHEEIKLVSTANL